jgi:hypothetical protein
VSVVTRRDVVDDAIRTSTLGWGIVTLAYSTRRAQRLEALSEGSATTHNRVEYWGTDEEGRDWRVHLRVGP